MGYGQLCGDDEKLKLENQNALLQYDEIRRLAACGRPDPSAVKIDVALLCHLHSLATAGIYSFSGRIRDDGVAIDGTGHKPPPANEVPGLVDEMFKYVADHWDAKPVHLCSYLLWRSTATGGQPEASHTSRSFCVSATSPGVRRRLWT